MLRFFLFIKEIYSPAFGVTSSIHKSGLKLTNPKLRCEVATLMNCFSHTEQAAVAICKSCGRGLCPACSEAFNNGIFCTHCVRIKVSLSYPDGLARDLPIYWLPHEYIPQCGDLITLPECDSTEEKVVRVLQVTCDLRRTNVTLNVETVSVGNRKLESK